MTGTDRISPEAKPPEKREFLDAVKSYICQILGFDYAFLDVTQGHEITNVLAFSADENDSEIKRYVESLDDENKQPVMVANSHVAQKVKQANKAWVGRAYSRMAEDKDGCPYVIVPLPDGKDGGVKGLLRVISFDASREVPNSDVLNLQRQGEHLASRLPEFAEKVAVKAMPETKAPIFEKETVLVVHSDRVVRRRYSRTLAALYTVHECDNGDRALEALRNSQVDLILLDGKVQDTSGYAFCKVLKVSPQWKHIPVILITSDAEPSALVEGLNVGADDCISDKCHDAELLARAKSSLRHRKTERELAVQLQMLEDYAQKLEAATEQLSQEKITETQRSKELALSRMESDMLRNQDALLHRISNTIRRSFNISENLHEMLEDLAGWFSLDLCFVVLPSQDEPADTLRCEYASQHQYFMMHTEGDLKTLEIFRRQFQLDQMIVVNDVAKDRRLEPFRNEILSRFQVFSLFYVPITYQEKLLGILAGYKCESEARWNTDNEAFLKSVADQIAIGVTNARLYSRVQRQATTDGLTNLFNHRTGQEKLAEQLRLAERYSRNLSVMMVDVDHFKSINDTYGHPAGDTVLKAVARLIKSNCRDVDVPVRYGGEEFLVVLPEVNQEGAFVVAERIRKALGMEVILHDDIEISVTASIGISSFPDDASTQQAVLDLADKSLYLSKRLGRNQVHTASDLMFEEVPPEVAREAAAAKAVYEEPDDIPEAEKFVPPEVSPDAREKEDLVPEVVEMVKALASALYSKSEYNKTHHLETARLSELLAKVMGLSQAQVEQIRVAGLLHDVGTLSLPSDLLNKQGEFTEEERAIINKHPVLGAQLLRPIRALKDICEILEHHHERWDGTGYPRGLKGESIPLAARIVAIVDSYHAMISDRPYRSAMTHESAVRALKAGAGSQFDPFLVDIFIAVLTSLKANGGQVTAATISSLGTLASQARPPQPETQPQPPDEGTTGSGTSYPQVNLDDYSS